MPAPKGVDGGPAVVMATEPSHRLGAYFNVDAA
jgi:hypothetical protein